MHHFGSCRRLLFVQLFGMALFVLMLLGPFDLPTITSSRRITQVSDTAIGQTPENLPVRLTTWRKS